MSTSGIYKITNKRNGKVYIGQSINIEERLKAHQRTKDTTLIHMAIQNEGKENFYYEILEVCEPIESLLNEKEIYWIAYFNANNKDYGYNMTAGGFYSSDACKKPVKQYDLEGRYIAEYPSAAEAGRLLDIDPRFISNCCRQIQNSAKGFQWCFVGEEENIKSAPKTNSGVDKIAVNQFSLEGKYLQTFSSILEASMAVGLKSRISIKKCCEEKSNNSAGGYQWRYSIDGTENITPYDSKKAHSTTNRPVAQIDKNTNQIINVFDSAKAAAEALNMAKGGNSAILRVCKGQANTSMGFKWQFIEE